MTSALALSYVPARHRPAIAALWALDAAMGEVVRTSSQPMLGAIRLAWWRERLEELDEGVPPPAEPRLREVADQLLPRGITAGELAQLEPAWLSLFDPFPWGAQTAEAIALRGRLLFALGGRMLGGADPRLASAGALWALVNVARRCSDGESRTMLLDVAGAHARGLAGYRFAPAVRPLTMLAALAARDAAAGEPFAAEGTPRRAARMLAHRLSGRMPRGG